MPTGDFSGAPRSDQSPDYRPRGYTKGKLSYLCKQCGAEGETYASQPRQFCSPACSMAYRSATGEGLRPRTGAELQCKGCSVKFYVPPGHVNHRVYCSHECATRHQSNQVAKPCAGCGKDIVGTASRVGRYCTRKCYLATRKPVPISKTCLICGKVVNRGANRYCSAECGAIGRRNGTDRACASCGKMFYVQPCDSDMRRYCSRACLTEGKKLKGPGSKVVRQDGYISVYYPTHPRATKEGVILEHRLVAEEKYGRPLLRSEHVHHLNGDRADNRPENLEVISPGDHARISNVQGVVKRMSEKAELAAFRAKYGPLKPDAE